MKQKVFVVGILSAIMSFVLSAYGVTTPVTPAATATPLPAPTLNPAPKLSDLKVLVTLDGGSELVPVFSPDVTEYALSINNEITDIGIVSSLANQSTDKITVDGNTVETGATTMVTPVVGISKVKIVVSAEGGKNTIYTISVNREDIQPLVNKFLKITFTDPATGINMGYRLFVPENYDPTRSYPLVMFLHGAGETGTDNEVQIAN